MYLNVVQLAESFGVDETVVEAWVRNEGLPHVPERGRLLFDRAQVAAWAVQRGITARAGFLASAAPSRSALRLEPLLRAGGIWRDVASAALPDVISQVVGRLPGASPAVRQLLAQRVRAPGGIVWAPVGGTLALPHLRAPVTLGGDSGILALLLLREPHAGADVAPDGEPILRMLFFIAPSPRAHLELLSRLSAALSLGALRPLVLRGAPDDEIFAALSSEALAPGQGAGGSGRGSA